MFARRIFIVASLAVLSVAAQVAEDNCLRFKMWEGEKLCVTCKIGFFLEENQCKACMDMCKVCSGPDTCDACKPLNGIGRFPFNDWTECKQCPSYCAKCREEDGCEECIVGAVKVLDQKNKYSCKPVGALADKKTPISQRVRQVEIVLWIIVGIIVVVVVIIFVAYVISAKNRIKYKRNFTVGHASSTYIAFDPFEAGEAELKTTPADVFNPYAQTQKTAEIATKPPADVFNPYAQAQKSAEIAPNPPATPVQVFIGPPK